jgi:hypothetical protein
MKEKRNVTRNRKKLRKSKKKRRGGGNGNNYRYDIYNNALSRKDLEENHELIETRKSGQPIDLPPNSLVYLLVDGEAYGIPYVFSEGASYQRIDKSGEIGNTYVMEGPYTTSMAFYTNQNNSRNPYTKIKVYKFEETNQVS